MGHTRSSKGERKCLFLIYTSFFPLAGRWYHGGIHIKGGERRLAMFEDLAKSKNWIIQTILEKSLFKSFNLSLSLAH